ncbi:MAG TPA: nicotinate phosphoribosyltransferase [Candidatus Bathyarchaeia archaeon]|nr:nicotinate phosphoribosyltransferase [Candidatus Bathyarchaeia archaeon]
MRKFQVATDDEIKNAETTDVYFTRTKEILESEGLSELRVTAEITTGSLPRNWEWGILAGVEEAAHLLEDVPIDVHSFPEGTLFHSSDVEGVREPVMLLEGRYLDFCLYETPLLGLLCQASGITTMAARVRRAAGRKTLLSFGIRRAHPALAPMIDRSCYVGGFDEVSSIVGARLLGKDPAGTMPHSLIIAIGDPVRAWKSFNKHMPKKVPRIALVDTYYDEKTESILAAEALGKDLYGVRLDTPSSRRGNFAEIVREVRWELDSRGFDHVKIFVSGGLNDETVADLSLAGADGFGVGTSVSNAPSIDFALDIVEADGKSVAKRGKLGGKKMVWRCDDCLIEKVTSATATEPECPNCGGKTGRLPVPLLSNGRLSKTLPSADKIRERVLGQLMRLSAS